MCWLWLACSSTAVAKHQEHLAAHPQLARAMCAMGKLQLHRLVQPASDACPLLCHCWAILATLTAVAL